MTVPPLRLLVAAAAILVPSHAAVAAAFAAAPRPATAPRTSPPPRVLVPEVPPAHLERVTDLVSSALLPDGELADRYAAAREAVATFQRMAASSADADSNTDDAYDPAGGDVEGGGKEHVPPSHELVYGELSLPVLATILDAVGVREGDVFLDIGSGDGALVLGASLLYVSTDDAANEGGEEEECRRGDAASATRPHSNAIRKSYGVDIVPGLVERSKSHAQKLEALLSSSDDEDHGSLRACQAGMHFLLGDVHAPNEELTRVLAETTVAVCFATTWSAGNARNNDEDVDDEDATMKTTSMTSLQGRKLPKLARALASSLTSGCRVVIVDGRLDEGDGFSWRGDLRVHCPDTAPYSVAALYVKA